MSAVFTALLAGVLTTLAPCVLPLLPVIVGGSLTGGQRRVWWIAAGLGASVLGFTLLLKASTILIDIPPQVWSIISGVLLIALGLVSAFPRLWDQISSRIGLQDRAHQGLVAARQRDGVLGAVLTGAALGPVFSSCSPLYGYLIVTVLPATPVKGLVLLISYVVGLVGALLLVALAGRRAFSGARWLAEPESWFRRGLGWVFVLVGVLVLTGLDRDLQTWLIIHAPVRPWEWVS